MTIIERARKCVEKRPPAKEGDNGNSTTFGVAALLVWGFGLEPSDALPLMLEYNERCDPPWSIKELERMLCSVVHRGHDKPRGYLVGDPNAEKGDAGAVVMDEPKRKRRKKFEIEALERVQDPTLKMDMPAWRKWLRERSPIDPKEVTAEAYLDSLYFPGEKILIFENMRSQGGFGRVIGKATWTAPKTPDGRAERIKALPPGTPEGMTFLMQPIDGKWYPKKGTNVLSRRTSASVTRWPYVLLESDKAPLEMWLNAIVRATFRIVSITESGGRSLHALVKVDKATEDELRACLDHEDARETLAVLGCDHQALNGMVYPRLPNTWRDGKQMPKLDANGQKMKDPKTGKMIMHFVPFKHGRSRQTLLYLNPSIEPKKSIVDGPRFERA